MARSTRTAAMPKRTRIPERTIVNITPNGDRQNRMQHLRRVLGLAGFDFASSPRLQKISGGGVSNALKKAEDYPEMNPETRSLLDCFFRPWNEKLSELTGMEFGWE